MFYNPDSGLNFTMYRAYDPVAGRWLSRDPLGEFDLTTLLDDGSLGLASAQYGLNAGLPQAQAPLGSPNPLSLFYNASREVNLYSYVNENPITYVDPLGEQVNRTIEALVRACMLAYNILTVTCAPFFIRLEVEREPVILSLALVKIQEARRSLLHDPLPSLNRSESNRPRFG